MTKLFLRLAAVIIALTCLSGPAYAEPYVSGFGGVSILSDSDLTDDAFPGVAIQAEFDAGFNVGGALGYDWGAIRGELELAYRQNDFEKFGGLEATGETTALAYLASLYYDVENQSSFTPYIGFGIGGASIDIDDLALTGFSGSTVNVDDTVFAYKIAAGVSYAINPSLDFMIDYSFLGTSDAEYDDGAGGTVEAEYLSHSISAGLRVRF